MNKQNHETPPEEIKPDVNNMSKHDAMMHLFQVEQHTYETESEYIERKIMRDQFQAQLDAAGLTIHDIVNPPRPKPIVESVPSPLISRLIKRL